MRKKIQPQLPTSRMSISPFNFPIATGVGCVDNDSIVKVDKLVEDTHVIREEVKIHAHTVAIETAADDGKNEVRRYAVGQSPPEVSCRDFLLQGSASELGLFQFVSRRAHRDGQDASGEAMSTMLTRLLNSAQDQGLMGLALDGCRTLTHINEVKDAGGDASCFELTIHDEKYPDQPQTIPLIQAGLRFTDKLLVAGTIKRASRLLDQYAPVGKRPASQQHDPLIVSTAGHSRNAVLMTYREIERQIQEGTVKDDRGLRAALQAVITAGRRTRSAHFVHSEKQLAELYLALQEALPKVVIAGRPGAGAKAQSLRAGMTADAPNLVPPHVPAPLRAASTLQLGKQKPLSTFTPVLLSRPDFYAS